MHFFKVFVTALLPLTSFVSAIASPNPAPEQAPGRILTPIERAYVESLLNAKRSEGGDHRPIEARQDLTTDLNQLLALISELGQFLSADFLNATYEVVVNLAALLDDPFVSDTRGIITQASSLLSSIEPLLSEITNLNLGSIVSSISPLLTNDSITGITTLLTNAENLLTANFVTEITNLINEVAPVCSTTLPCPFLKRNIKSIFGFMGY